MPITSEKSHPIDEKSKRLQAALADSETMRKFLIERGFNHTYFKHYTKGYKAQNIIEYNSLFLSTGDDWNDTTDRNNKILKFSVCFSCAESENVAMWMLYSGLDNNGIMFDFRKSDIKKICRAAEVTLIKWKNDKPVDISAVPHNAFEIYPIDIVYLDTKKNDNDIYAANIRRQDETVASLTPGEFKTVKPFTKSFAWHYESECRLVVEITDEKIKRFVDENDIRDVSVKFPIDEVNIGDSVKAVANPQYVNCPVRFQKSKLFGEVHWKID